MSQGAAVTSLSEEDSGASTFSDIQSFMLAFENETIFVNQMTSIIQALSSTLSTAAEQLDSYFDIKSGFETNEDQSLWTRAWLHLFANDKIGKKFLSSLTPRQLMLMNFSHEQGRRREDDPSYLPASQIIDAWEVASLKAFMNEPNLCGRTGDNIRVLSVGLPNGLLDTLQNPPYVIGSKESTELHEQRNVVEIHIHKRDLEHEDIIFKPKKFLFDKTFF